MADEVDPSQPVSPFPPRAVSTGLEPGFKRYLPLVDPKVLREQYLFGLPLRSNMDGSEMDDDDLIQHIIRAISHIEHELKIFISPIEAEEPFDYNINDYTRYNFIQTRQYPILQVINIKGKFPNSHDFLVFPSEWYVIDSEWGGIRLAPTNGAITQFFLTNEASYLPLILGSRSDWPHLWTVHYLTGFWPDKIPALINDLIAIQASIQILSMLGPVMFPYSSYGIGLDGVSQSVSTAGVQQLAARLTDLQTQYQQKMDIAKGYYLKKLVCGVL